MERKLAAILAADVVGYSALMERDEAGTFDALAERTRDAFNEHYVSAGGTIVSDCTTVYTLAIAFGLVAIGGSWKPELGLDLQGGTSIRLTPKGNPSAESLNEARKIIDQRVNGSGVAEAEVTVQGNKYIVVEIPGDSRRDLVDTVKRQAQLRFRLVACSDSDPSRCQAGASSGSTSFMPRTGERPVAMRRLRQVSAPRPWRRC